MTKTTKHTAPTVFHRVFLSHLIVVLLCFIAAVWLLHYLYGDGLRYFRIHSPLVILPVTLGLIGLAGLLALWTAGAIVLPLERFSDALRGGVGSDDLQRLADRAGVDESADAMLAAASFVERVARGDSRPYTLVVDGMLNIVGADIDTAARFGMTPSDILRRHLRDLLAAHENVAEVSAWIRSAGDTLTERRRISMHAAAGRIMNAQWAVLALSTGQFVLTGYGMRGMA
jgi:hypothetical protein